MPDTQLKVSMTDLFPACSRVLDKLMRPVQYRDLTRLALEEMGVEPYLVHQFRVFEDVREKMVEAGRFDTFYTGQPDCLVVKRDWFHPPMLKTDEWGSVLIPVDLDSGIQGAYEALMRAGHMITKKAGVSTERLNGGRARGLQIEANAVSWFRRSWPDFFRLPDNDGQYDKWCSHDFKLQLPHALWEIDIVGPSATGDYRKPDYKKGTDFHFACKPVKDGLLWHAAKRGDRYEFEGITPDADTPPVCIVVYLNCLKMGIDYAELKATCPPPV